MSGDDAGPGEVSHARGVGGPGETVAPPVVTEATAGPAAPAASAPLRLAASAAVTAGTAGAEVTADAVPVA